MRSLAAGLLLVLLGGCADPGTGESPTGEAEEPATRIVSLAPNITELLFAAGAGDRIVGTVAFSDFPEAALRIPRVGDSFRVDYEALAQLKPDVVLAWTSGNPAETVQRIRSLDYRVVSLEAVDLDSIAEQIEFLGELAGTRAAAHAAADNYRERLAQLRQRPVQTPLRLFWQISADPYFTLTGAHLVDEVITLCGGENIFRDLPGLAPVVTLEAILAARPDVIIAVAKPGDTQWQAAWQTWQALPAVQNAALFGVDPDLVSRSGPRILDGAVRVCAALDEARARLPG